MTLIIEVNFSEGKFVINCVGIVLTVNLYVCSAHICVIKMITLMMMAALGFLKPPSHLRDLYIGVQSEDRSTSTTLGSALHQCLCQQGAFRRGPMTRVVVDRESERERERAHEKGGQAGQKERWDKGETEQ